MGPVYLPTWMVDFYGFHVGKYASPMDGMGMVNVLGISISSWGSFPFLRLDISNQPLLQYKSLDIQANTSWEVFEKGMFLGFANTFPLRRLNV